jgi:folate-binding protein YgfZ
MNDLWEDALRRRGAVLERDAVLSFADPTVDLSALESGTTLHPLADGLLDVQGDDAGPFLQAQLTSDVLGLHDRHAQYSAYCTAKGRILATFLLLRTAAGYRLQLPRSLVQPIRTRLQKFVLRAKLRMADASDGVVLLGLGGPQAGDILARTVGTPPALPLEVAIHGNLTVVALENRCYELLAPPEQAADLWDRLALEAQPAGVAGWEWRRIRAGIPWVTLATQEAFVPQMVDLDRIGAISFTKGCYPGQEIVARAQYLGLVKRRLYRFHAAAEAVPGQNIFSPAGATDQTVGTVLNAAPAPGGGCDGLAVVQVEAAEPGSLQLGSPAGPALALHALSEMAPARELSTLRP